MAFRRAIPIIPFTIIAGPGIVPLFPEQRNIDGFWLLVAVRDMDTSTWVRIGDVTAQVSTMYYANDFYVWDCPSGYVFDFANFYCSSENGDVVLEVTGMQPGPEVVLPVPSETEMVTVPARNWLYEWVHLGEV